MPKNLQKGFTLVEMTMVIAIILIMASVAIPRIGQFIADRELNGAAKMLAADIRLLQQMTINSNDFNEKNATPLLNLYRTSPCTYNISQNTHIIKNVALPESVQMSYSSRTISFSINGIPVQGYTITLSSTACDKNKYVVVAAATGRVRISDVYDVD